jgi:2,3-diketo-5-methylthio-1-phosphopentane phosphatase/methylthioribulose-1-phosphate dehydratase
VASRCEWVVLDIEGTVSPTAAITCGLHDYARHRLKAWIAAHAEDPAVQAAVAAVPSGPDEDVVAVLHQWMDSNVKAAPLKTLQGQIWAAGFAAGELTAEFFPDVVPVLRAWHAAGVRLAVFSSGSVTRQHAWFAHGPDGDLSGLIDGWFDVVNAGRKREPGSYTKIAMALGVDGSEIVLLTDTEAELKAAVTAGWRAIGMARADEPGAIDDFPDVVSDLHGLSVLVKDSCVLEAAGRIAETCGKLAALGWMRGTSGNVSEVLTKSPLLLAVSATERDKSTLAAGDVAVVGAAGQPIVVPGFKAAKPPAGAALHARIAAVSGAGAVVHVHTVCAVRAAAQSPDGIVLSDLEMLKGLGRAASGDKVKIPVIPNSQDPAALGDAFAAAHDASVPMIVVAGHGLYAWGEDLDAARRVAEYADWLLDYAVASPPGPAPAGPAPADPA